MLFPWKHRMIKSFNWTVLYIPNFGFRCWLACLFGEFAICMCGLGSFLLQDMFLNLPVSASKEKNKTYFDAGPGCVIRTVCKIITVCKYSMLILITDIKFVIVFFFKWRRSFTSRNLYVCLHTFYLVELILLYVLVVHFVRSRFKGSCFHASLLTVLRTVYAIDEIHSRLSAGQTLFWSSMWISSVAGNCKILWTNFWHATVTVLTRWHSTPRYY